MADFFLPIASKKHETADVISVCFDTKAAAVKFQAGQFLKLTLEEVSDPRGSWRFFSFASSPTEDFIMIATKITRRDVPSGTSQGPFKQKLASLNVGDTVRLNGPYGKFVLANAASKQHVFLSGGIGITPFRSMLKYATDKKLPHKIVLLYSNQTPEDIVFKEDLDIVARENPNITIVNTITRPPDQSTANNEATLPAGRQVQQFNNNALWKWEKGRINEDMVKKYAKDLASSIFYVCGPPSMAESLIGVVNALGIPQENIKAEQFTGYP